VEDNKLYIKSFLLLLLLFGIIMEFPSLAELLLVTRPQKKNERKFLILTFMHCLPV
jgi:hypothetical protein